MLVTQELFNFIESFTYRSGFPSLSLLPGPVITVMHGMMFKNYNPFYEMVDDKIRQMIPGGIMQHLYKEQVRIKKTSSENSVRNSKEPIDPQVLTMDQLKIGFLICAAMLCLSTIVFVVELGIPFYYHLVDVLTACSVVKTFLKRQFW